jgi:myo-inositol-1-phosphate synthase
VALGYEPHATVGIEYVPSLGNWKTAWDFVHFRGFLGTKMSLQFIWQGCDSILAAPLVLDLWCASRSSRSGRARSAP